jgi:hypothetical protein
MRIDHVACLIPPIKSSRRNKNFAASRLSDFDEDVLVVMIEQLGWGFNENVGGLQGGSRGFTSTAGG